MYYIKIIIVCLLQLALAWNIPGDRSFFRINTNPRRQLYFRNPESEFNQGHIQDRHHGNADFSDMYSEGNHRDLPYGRFVNQNNDNSHRPDSVQHSNFEAQNNDRNGFTNDGYQRQSESRTDRDGDNYENSSVNNSARKSYSRNNHDNRERSRSNSQQDGLKTNLDSSEHHTEEALSHRPRDGEVRTNVQSSGSHHLQPTNPSIELTTVPVIVLMSATQKTNPSFDSRHSDTNSAVTGVRDDNLSNDRYNRRPGPSAKTTTDNELKHTKTERAKDDEEEWVWGDITTTKAPATRLLPEGDLDDRTSFNGDGCPKDAGRRGVTTDGLLSALARLRRPPPPLPHPHPALPALPARPADGRHQAPKIQSSRPSPELAAGADGSMTVARGEESPERLGGALRRLHYRATRRAHSAAARHHAGTPKVVVMGSSTTSDKTINTSTDSAATALTSVTGTDDSMDADCDPPEPRQPNLIDADPPDNPPSTAPPHYHRPQNSYEFESPAYTNPQSATDVMDSPRPGPARFIFDVPLPDPKTEERKKPELKSQVSQSVATTSMQIPYDPKTEIPKSPKLSQTKYETHFNFEPEQVKRRGSEPRLKNKQKIEKQEYYKDEVAKLRRQLEGTEVFTTATARRRSSAHQHSVPPPSSRRQSTAAQVHVTANPLDAASSMPAGRTTIVVQQPSLSLDYGGCCTMLVRDGEDGRRKSRVCSDHIQQLLDVTSQFTSEDFHEFDKRYGSPHHSRSQSVKAQRSRAGERQLLGLPQQRARVASMPNTGVEEEYYRLRHFSITGKGVVNRGDSLRSRRSRSNTSVASSASSTEAITRASAPCSLASSRDSSAGLSNYRVLVLGGPGVGKSSLVGQFMTSEYLHAYDTSIDDESGERSVCVLLAGEESEITFLDSPPDHVVTEGHAHGYCVVYSTAERASFAEAERRLQALWAAGHTARRAVILVGNKADLARSRAVPTDEGKAVATSYECKFIETSVGINHNVDELLVGLLTQIRLKQQHAEKVKRRSSSRKNRSRARSPLEGDASAPATASASSTPRKRTRLSASVKVRGLLGRVWARDSKSKSCENLHVL